MANLAEAKVVLREVQAEARASQAEAKVAEAVVPHQYSGGQYTGYFSVTDKN